MERVYQLALVLVAVRLTALGPSVGPAALIGATACVVILSLSLARSRWQHRRHPGASALVEQTVQPVTQYRPDLSGLDPAVVYVRPAEQARLLRQGAEAPAKRSEREAIQRDARQISKTYRAMHRLNGIDNTSTQDRVKMLERVMALQRHRDAYLDRWTVVVPDPGSFIPQHSAVRPTWLDAMAQDADVIVWQLESEDTATGGTTARADPRAEERAKRMVDEQRTAVRDVRSAITEAMTQAEQDREHGEDDARSAAVAAAIRAGSIVHEVADDEIRRLVGDWRARFDHIEKGWKEGGLVTLFGNEQKPLGYPEPEWSDLRHAADAALARIGTILRETLS